MRDHDAERASVFAADQACAAAQRELGAIAKVLEEAGCGCDCGCDCDGHGPDCEPCLGCRIDEAVREVRQLGGRMKAEFEVTFQLQGYKWTTCITASDEREAVELARQALADCVTDDEIMTASVFEVAPAGRYKREAMMQN